MDALRDSTDQLVFYECGASHLSSGEKHVRVIPLPKNDPVEFKLFTRWAAYRDVAACIYAASLKTRSCRLH
jgi:hypothetical protein